MGTVGNYEGGRAGLRKLDEIECGEIGFALLGSWEDGSRIEALVRSIRDDSEHKLTLHSRLQMGSFFPPALPLLESLPIPRLRQVTRRRTDSQLDANRSHLSLSIPRESIISNFSPHATLDSVQQRRRAEYSLWISDTDRSG